MKAERSKYGTFWTTCNCQHFQRAYTSMEMTFPSQPHSSTSHRCNAAFPYHTAAQTICRFTTVLLQTTGYLLLNFHNKSKRAGEIGGEKNDHTALLNTTNLSLESRTLLWSPCPSCIWFEITWFQRDRKATMRLLRSPPRLVRFC